MPAVVLQPSLTWVKAHAGLPGEDDMHVRSGDARDRRNVMFGKDHILFAGLAILAMAASLFGMPALAQPAGPPASGDQPMMERGAGAGMRGDAMGRHGMMCGPRLAGMVAEHLASIEDAVAPTEAQRASFEALKTAADRARVVMRAACSTPPGATQPDRLDAMQARLEAMLQAMAIVRPAFDAFYGTLDDTQKGRLDDGGRWMRGPAGWPWRHSDQDD